MLIHTHTHISLCVLHTDVANQRTSNGFLWSPINQTRLLDVCFRTSHNIYLCVVVVVVMKRRIEQYIAFKYMLWCACSFAIWNVFNTLISWSKRLWWWRRNISNKSNSLFFSNGYGVLLGLMVAIQRASSHISMPFRCVAAPWFYFFFFCPSYFFVSFLSSWRHLISRSTDCSTSTPS